MPDRENVIKGLEQIVNDPFMKARADYWVLVCSEAIALLKEQEAVKPEVYYVSQDKYKFYRCPECKINWYYKGNYCLGCGRKVKWE